MFSEEPTIFFYEPQVYQIESLGCLVFPSKNCYNYFNKCLVLLRLPEKVVDKLMVVEGSRPGKALSPWRLPADQKARRLSVGVLDIRYPK